MQCSNVAMAAAGIATPASFPFPRFTNAIDGAFFLFAGAEAERARCATAERTARETRAEAAMWRARAARATEEALAVQVGDMATGCTARSPTFPAAISIGD